MHTVVPFAMAHVSEAARLLAGRHAAERVAMPALPASFEDPKNTRKAIEHALGRPHAAGFAALDGDSVVAYLIGDLILDDDLWGRSGWVREAGCALARSTDPHIVADLYAAIGSRWVSYGALFHFAFVPVADTPLLQTWVSLSFGIEQVHGIADLWQADSAGTAAIPGIDVRQVRSADREGLAALSNVVWSTQIRAPVWAVTRPEDVPEYQSGWAGLVDDEKATVWVAVRDGRIIAAQTYFPAEKSDDDLHIPDSCIRLVAAGTRADERGKGVGTLLTKHAFAEARAAGYRYCESDWRSTNLLSSRFWPKRGFRPALYRMVRRVDRRILWAHGSARDSDLAQP